MRAPAFYVAFAFALAACAASRDAEPLAAIQPQDARSNCPMIRAEIQENNQRATKLAKEKGGKVVQNDDGGLVGVVVWPEWRGMDGKDAASKEAAALQARQERLTYMAIERCEPGYQLPPPR